MGVCRNNRTFVVAITVALLMASGCSGHSVKYGANSGENEGVPGENGNEMKTDGVLARANSSGGGSGIQGEPVDGSNPYLRSAMESSQQSANALAGSTAKNEREGLEGIDGMSGRDRRNYGHEFEGVNGSNPNHGPVSGFGNGYASSKNPDPEAWANAYLGNGSNSREFYGDPGKAGTSYNGSSPEGMNPSTWAENFTKEHGGPSPEYVNPDMSIAHAKIQQTGESVGGESIGIGRTDREGSIIESSFSGAMGIHSGDVQDIYFDFDSWTISAEAAKFLEEGAQWLQTHPGKTLTIEGHCDQRGTQDYNLVLGQKRAEAAREYLIHLGVQSDRIRVVSYGKERPFCQNDSENCFQENRRNHMIVRMN